MDSSSLSVTESSSSSSLRSSFKSYGEESTMSKFYTCSIYCQISCQIAISAIKRPVYATQTSYFFKHELCVWIFTMTLQKQSVSSISQELPFVIARWRDGAEEFQKMRHSASSSKDKTPQLLQKIMCERKQMKGSSQDDPSKIAPPGHLPKRWRVTLKDRPANTNLISQNLTFFRQNYLCGPGPAIWPLPACFCFPL